MSKLISKSEKIFIAGSSGMVGSALKRVLINFGYGDEVAGGKLLTPTKKEFKS